MVLQASYVGNLLTSFECIFRACTLGFAVKPEADEMPAKGDMC